MLQYAITITNNKRPRATHVKPCLWWFLPVISNPLTSSVCEAWRGQASPLHFQQEATGFDIISIYMYVDYLIPVIFYGCVLERDKKSSFPVLPAWD